jgi:hypothetical protein
VGEQGVVGTQTDPAQVVDLVSWSEAFGFT